MRGAGVLTHTTLMKASKKRNNNNNSGGCDVRSKVNGLNGMSMQQRAKCDDGDKPSCQLITNERDSILLRQLRSLGYYSG